MVSLLTTLSTPAGIIPQPPWSTVQTWNPTRMATATLCIGQATQTRSVHTILKHRGSVQSPVLSGLWNNALISTAERGRFPV